MATTTEPTMDVWNDDGMNRCRKCGQRAGVDYDPADPRNPVQGWMVHDRTGRIECNPADVAAYNTPVRASGEASPW